MHIQNIIELIYKYFFIKCCFKQVRKFQKVSCLHFYQWVYYCSVEKYFQFFDKSVNKRDFLIHTSLNYILAPKTYIHITFYEHSMQFQKNQFALAGVLPLRISRKRKPCSEYIPYFEKKEKQNIVHVQLGEIISEGSIHIFMFLRFHNISHIKYSWCDVLMYHQKFHLMVQTLILYQENFLKM